MVFTNTKELMTVLREEPIEQIKDLPRIFALIEKYMNDIENDPKADISTVDMKVSNIQTAVLFTDLDNDMKEVIKTILFIMVEEFVTVTTINNEDWWKQIINNINIKNI